MSGIPSAPWLLLEAPTGEPHLCLCHLRDPEPGHQQSCFCGACDPTYSSGDPLKGSGLLQAPGPAPAPQQLPRAVPPLHPVWMQLLSTKFPRCEI